MKTDKLKQVESIFLARYPEGFESPDLVEIAKKHNVQKRSEQVLERFAPDGFARPGIILEHFVKTVSQSSLVSLFEKSKVRDAVAMMGMDKKEKISEYLYELLHDDQRVGFEGLVEIFAQEKLAKWALVTLLPYYYARDQELFVKPNTTKDIIAFFELEGLKYRPRPEYDFYLRYKEALQEMKAQVDPSLGNDNGKFTGFLMMGMGMVSVE